MEGPEMKLFRLREILPQLPDLIVNRRIKFKFERIPFEVNGLAAKKIANFFRAGLNQYLLPSRPLGYPVVGQVEPANFCNLSCPLCLTTSETGARPAGLLPLDLFRAFIDNLGDYLLLIVLWNWGEPFLNPDLLEMIAYAKSRKILIHSSTNGQVGFDDGLARGLVESGLDSLIFGIDGTTQESYARYRRGGDLEVVRENIKILVSTKKSAGSRTPRLTLRFVAMRQNEGELDAAHQMARELGVDSFAVKTVDMPPALGRDLDRLFAPGDRAYQRYAYEDEGFRRKKLPFTCMRPWKRITLDALGEIIPCEYDYRNGHSFGSLRSGLPAVSLWKGRTARKFRQSFNRGHNDYYLCRTCTYKNRVAEDCTVALVDLSGRDGAPGEARLYYEQAKSSRKR
jgi:radical SAM protein with 4Fe4S-binding SPASM domain